MEIRPLTDDYAVSPQIAAEDLPAIANAGYVAVICNRPDAEVGPESGADAIEAAATAAGLAFVRNPVTHQGLDETMVARQRQALDEAGGPVLAYCASGTRSTIVWALGQSGRRPAEEIVERAARAGYDIAGLGPRLG